jgi:glyoxylase-like metal-dependent hydrolase (beta-lactamase superfamily II)
MRLLNVGSIRCFLLKDGTFQYPKATLDSEQARTILGDLPDEVPIPYTAMLLDNGTQRVLLDTGAGPLGPFTGRLQSQIHEAGYTPDLIDMVFITHAHADHIGGLLNEDGRFAYPNARLLMARAEWEFWLSLSLSGKLGTGQLMGIPPLEDLMHQWLKRYLFPLADRVELLDGEREISRGVNAFAAPGHTPGHMGVALASGGEQALYVADAFLLPEQVKCPEWNLIFDTDRPTLVNTRRQILDRASADRCRVIAFHFPSDGFVSQQGNDFTWEPAHESQETPSD